MLNALLAAVAMVGGGTTHYAPDDWRAELPIPVQQIVARVDRQEAEKTLKEPLLEDPEDAKKLARHLADVKSDIEMGRKYAEEIAKDPKMKVSTNADMIARLQRIASELAPIANQHQVAVTWGDPQLSVFPYEFKVLQGDDKNAFSIPGGFVYFYEGLMKYAESDDEIAGVLAHEIAHASFRHIATLRKEASKLDIIQIPLILVAILSGGGETAQGVLMGGSLLNTALTNGWGVKAEQAADYGAIQYMRYSKYNPVGVLTLMERLAYDERSRPLPENMGIFMTHPPTRERALAAARRLAEGGIQIRRSQVTQTLRTQVRPGDSGSVDLWYANIRLASFGGTDALTRADAAAVTLDNFFDGVPKIFEIQTDGLTIRGKGRELFTLTLDDVAVAKGKPDEVAEEAARALKRAAYDLSYRVWDAQY